MSRAPRPLSALLCCEDERVQQALERAEMRVLLGLTAGEALRTLEKEALDVVISDVGTDPTTSASISFPPTNSTLTCSAVCTTCAAVRILPSSEMSTPEPRLASDVNCPSSSLSPVGETV